MIVPLIIELRKRHVPVGMQEAIALAEAVSKGLHNSSLHQFYYIARSLLIHDESNLDDFDQVFSFLVRDIPYSKKHIEDLLLSAEQINRFQEWLKDPRQRPELTPEEFEALKSLSPEELKRMLEERLQEQKERHDGGSHWIGTGGTSPFGTGGVHPTGISLRSIPASGAGGKSLLNSIDARRYRSYRSDLVLDVRQIEVALRKLRKFDREGSLTELNLERTVDSTAKNFGDLDLVFQKPRKSNTRVILMMDVGGSMDPFAALVSQLFSAARRATHWKELRTYYFHNSIYGQVYKTDGLREPFSLRDLVKECHERYYLIIVGDASMAPYELLGGSDSLDENDRTSSLAWLYSLRNHFDHSVWLNPDLNTWRGSTVEAIAQVFPMFPLTLQGLEEALQQLKKV